MTLANASSPAWIAGADRLYALSLAALLPRATHQQLGTDMRQAFRDRCREVARGERSLAALLLGEIVPDLLQAAWLENAAATSRTQLRRWLGWGAAVAVTLGLALGANAIGDWYWNHFNPQRQLFVAEQDRQQALSADLSGFIAFLDAQPAPDARAAGLWLRSLAASPGYFLAGQTDREARQQEQQARELADRVNALGTQGLTAAALAALADVCAPDAGCDLERLRQALERTDPGNGYVQLYRLGHTRGRAATEAVARSVLEDMAASERVDGKEVDWMRSVLALRDRYTAADPALDRALYETASLKARQQTGFLVISRHCKDPAWQADESANQACARVATLFAASGNAIGGLAAARIRAAQAGDDASRREAEAQARQWRDLWHRWIESTSGETTDELTRRWQQAWREASSEADARRRWLSVDDRAFP